ncbi:mucin-2-like [Phlebotomus argentipes]|uniref:mucin-2-like n=1 Tax=Phlebotomus argentipes TaxID=94469 RepID=UPI002893236A|nr:mucin-2-like [Phlebotomus argentipes]
MRFIVICVALLGLFGAAKAVDVVAYNDGQPGCFIRYEFTRLWRNNFDQHAFWRCERWGEGAVRHECPPFTSFQDFWQTCLPNDVWEWTPYSDPPTRPDEEILDQCEPIENPTPCPTNPPITTPTPDWNTTTTDEGEWNTTTTDGGEWNTTTTDGGEWNMTTTDSGEWNTTTTDSGEWNTTTTDGGEWNTTTTDSGEWNTTTTDGGEWNTTTTDSGEWNTTTTDGGEWNTTQTPDFSTSPNENESTPDPTTTTPGSSCPTCPPTCPTCPPETTTPSIPTPPEEGETPKQLCPGAEPHQYVPGNHSCTAPTCTYDQWLDGTLYPTLSPVEFYQCGPEGYLYTMPCAPGTCFSYDHQVCVHFRDWVYQCEVLMVPDPLY